MKVLALTKYDLLGASSRVRFELYRSHLKASDIDLDFSPFFDDEYLDILYKEKRKSIAKTIQAYLRRLIALFSLYRYDRVWIEKELFPYLPAIFERLLKLFGLKYIVDYDDAVFHNYDLSGNPMIRFCLKKKIDTVMAKSAVVTAGNTYLMDRAIKAKARRVEFLPTVVDESKYKKNTDPKDVCVIGWIGSPATQDYVLGIKEALETVAQDHHIELHLIGARPEIAKRFTNLTVKVIPWSAESEGELISHFDIGIMPLPDGPWERGKCGYKLIQYMACSVPVIGSSVGVNAEIINNCQSGILVKGESTIEWRDALIAMISNPKARVEYGTNGRIGVEKTYGLSAQAPRLIKILKGIE